MLLLSERLSNIVRLLKAAFGSYAPHITLIIALGFFASILEGIGISAVIPLFSFVTGGGGQAADTITKIITEIFSFLGLPYTFRLLVIFVGALFVTRILALFAIQYVTARIMFGYERDLRARMFASTLGSGWPFLSLQKVGHLDQLLITNTTNVSQFFGMFSTLVLIFTKTIAYIIIAINVSPIVAALSVVVGAVLFLGLKPLFQLNKAISARAEELNRSLAHFVSQHISGMKTVKSFVVEFPVSRKAREYFESIRSVHMNMVMLRGILEMGIQFAGLAFVAGVFVYMYWFTGFNFAAFAVIVFAVNQIFTQVQAVQVQLHSLSAMLPYLTSAFAYVRDADENAEEIAAARSGSAKSFILRQGIEFRNISFSYPGRRETLSDVSFTIPQGNIVGIVGPSGVGKSTVADLLLRLVEPTMGAIHVDGDNLRKISLSEWRESVGYVTQDMFLLNDTVRSNIAFYDSSISDRDVIRAAKLAHIHEFLETLPKKYNTFVGDRGHFLSGGQRQRIVLARILARKPQLLVLDEATSALDAESQRAIRDTIEGLRGKTTIVVIAHRDDIILSADLVIVLADGKVVEVGRPKDIRSVVISSRSATKRTP